MTKFILAVAVIGLTACGSAKTEEAPVADSTAVAAPADTITAVADSTAVAAPVATPAAK